MTPSKSTSLYLNNFVSDLVDTTSSPFLPGNRERIIFCDSKFRATPKILRLPIEHSTIPNGVRCVIADLEIPPWLENAIGSLFTRAFTPSSGLFTVAWYRSRYKKEGWRCTRGILQLERCLLAESTLGSRFYSNRSRAREAKDRKTRAIRARQDLKVSCRSLCDRADRLSGDKGPNWWRNNGAKSRANSHGPDYGKR